MYKIALVEDEKNLANLVVIDRQLNVYQTIRCGNIIYKKETN